MTREEILRRLQAILNELTCMNPGELEKKISGSTFESIFDHMSWTENSKIQTKITIQKIKIENTK